MEKKIDQFDIINVLRVPNIALELFGLQIPSIDFATAGKVYRTSYMQKNILAHISKSLSIHLAWDQLHDIMDD